MKTAKETTQQSFKPRFSMPGVPDWFHHHGIKLQHVESLSYELVGGHVRFSGGSSGTSLTIASNFPGNGWNINYTINHGFDQARTTGFLWMDDDEVKLAFGFPKLMLPTPEDSLPLLERYGGDVAIPGKFIRYRGFLNIPGPGTGQDGDPNISILIVKEIKDNLQVLFGQVHRIL